MKKITQHLILILVASVGVVACGVDEKPEPPQTSVEESESGLSCAPNQQRCDPGCTVDGGPANEECRIGCIPNGHNWITLENCGTGHCRRSGFTTVCVP